MDKIQTQKQKEEQWLAFWEPKLCLNDGTQTAAEFQASILREKKLWWLLTFGETYVPDLYTRIATACGIRAGGAIPHSLLERELLWETAVSRGVDKLEKRLWWRLTFGIELEANYDNP